MILNLLSYIYYSLICNLIIRYHSFIPMNLKHFFITIAIIKHTGIPKMHTMARPVIGEIANSPAKNVNPTTTDGCIK